ncbi:uncharacterized protein JCM6883_001556 [Sporobolomyces salmoneus]|uniref:uncharacterized protein n=1 Tax=Sporobolomyces salmoneus TaxID=183962 RepID=UPI0031701053
MIGTLAGWASLGFGVRCYQLAIMKRNIFENLSGHVLSAGAFTGIGYWAIQADARNRDLIAEKKEQLLRMREKDTPLGEETAEHH